MKRREQNDLIFISGDVTLYMYYYENCTLSAVCSG